MVAVTICKSAAAAEAPLELCTKSMMPEISTIIAIMMTVVGSCSPEGASTTLVIYEIAASASKMSVKGLAKHFKKRITVGFSTVSETALGPLRSSFACAISIGRPPAYARVFRQTLCSE